MDAEAKRVSNGNTVSTGMGITFENSRVDARMVNGAVLKTVVINNLWVRILLYLRLLGLVDRGSWTCGSRLVDW